jgi:predicted HicB family RNase H-like nuclease|tara:strand:+ start:218 stop:376 length:159 start_codon:yes stop_codon:yes gene_type:complete
MKDYPRTEFIHIRANPDIKKAAQKEAKDRDISLSDYIENLIYKNIWGKKSNK